MLTGDLVRPRLRQRGSRLYIDRVGETTPHWLQTAAQLIRLFQETIGQPRATWDAALEAYEGERIDYIVIRGLAKVLCDAATFAPLDTPLPPSELRRQLFAHGPAFANPILFQPQSREDILGEVAQEQGLTPEAVEAALFADRPAAYRLGDPGPDWTPEALLARYNLELARGVLYWATRMEIEIHDGYKDFWRYLKLFKLMFWARPLEQGGYHVELDGPLSPFVKSTTRYGRQFAAFLPALLLGERWRMAATVRPPGFQAELTYRLDDSASLPSVFKRSGAFDSKMEADFAAEFQAKFGQKRGQWELTREDEVLLLADTVMIPDFALTHRKDGRRVLVEIVGFWHPEYLRRKVEKVRQAGRRDMILLVYEGANLAGEKLEGVPGEVLYFKNKPILKDVMAAVKQVAGEGGEHKSAAQ
jgi:predicted nuclease of restriction endonuclease-like RecB superfamily